MPPRGLGTAPTRVALACACVLVCATQPSSAYGAGRAADSSPQRSPQEAEMREARYGSDGSVSKVDCSPPSIDPPAPTTVLSTPTTRAPADTPTTTTSSVPPTTPTLALVNETECATPDGQIGRCVNLYDCPYLVQLLEPPLLQENELFVRNSKCESDDPLSVCCAESPPDTKKPFVKPKNCEPGAAPPDPRTGCCGRPSGNDDRISMGEDTGIDQYPWMALIEYKGRSLLLLCGGALISSRYVLTAAHCVVGNKVMSSGIPTNVRLGEYNTGNEIRERDCVRAAGGGWDCADPPLVIPIEQFIVHLQYKSWDPNQRNDIALLRLKYMAPYTGRYLSVL